MITREVYEMLSVLRRELKFLMSHDKAVELQNELDMLLCTDKYSQKGYYNVRSLYYDSWNNKDFIQKFDGLENRRKIRIRVYSSKQESAKFEIKEKQGVYQKKDSLIVDRQHAEAFIKGEYAGLLDYEEPAAHRLFALMTLGAYRPVSVIEYERRAYMYDKFNTRITFDKNIRSCENCFDIFSDDIPFMPVFMEQVILEVKFNGTLLESVKSILGKYNLTNVSMSKYEMGRPVWANYIYTHCR
ncbi:MAG: polyphosphate polymerase domain-containing protein [Lachnospiraceae bacterium]|nr:polyphosphate polymerase domain-containing protein [Lachnospiraceae bacterium]